jgi:hypothetical protein
MRQNWIFGGIGRNIGGRRVKINKRDASLIHMHDNLAFNTTFNQKKKKL